MPIRRALVMAGALTAMACKAHAPAAPPATPVRVAPALKINAPITITATGVVAPMQTVNVESQVTGAVIDVAFREGEHVDSGEVLFRIDPRELQATVEQARANLTRDLATADAAVRDDARYRTLATKGYVTQEQADQMHAAAVGAQAVGRADSAVLKSDIVNLGFATLYSPIAGRAGKLIVRLGNVVSPTAGPLVVVDQLHPIMVQFAVLAQDLPLLRRAVATHPLPVTAVASDTTNTSEAGQLSLLNNTIDSLTGTVTAQAIMPNAHALFWPGQLVGLTIQAGVQQNAVAVPTEAVMTGQQGPYVFVVDSTKKTAQMRTITAGRSLDTLMIVVTGLAAGEEVVIDGQSRLAPGGHVKILPAMVASDTASGSSSPAKPAAAKGGKAPATRPTAPPHP